MAGGPLAPQTGLTMEPISQRAATAMYVDDESRLDAAEQLAGYDRRAAAEAFSVIACDQEVGDEVRLSAAEQLAALDPSA